MRLRHRGLGLVLILGMLLGIRFSRAEVIRVSPEDADQESWRKIEGAQAGDEVVVAPGTYRFRVYLECEGTESQPIVIRAEDPHDRPVWDLAGDVCGNWPGSYGGGDAYRAIWQVTGSYYLISGIVFRNGSDGGTGDSGGLRMKFSDHLTLRDCLLQYNDNGLQGAGTSTLVEFCDFDSNGLPGSADASHNLYIHGGDLVVRYCFIHDARRAQNMHMRANRAVFEYNWIARSSSYMGDMMPCTMEPCDADQYLVLRGNVIERGTPANDGQVFALYNDQGASGKRFHLSMIANTILGNGDNAALVHICNDDPVLNELQEAVLENNAIVDLRRIFRVDEPGLSNWQTGGTRNWLSQGTADTGGLEGSVLGADPGFADPAGGDYRPASGSALIQAAAGSTRADPPDREYCAHLQYRWRAGAADIGAFESTTVGDPIGAYGDDPEPDGGTQTDGGAGTDGGDAGISDAGTGDGGEVDGGEGGCGCASGGAAGAPIGVGLLVLLGLRWWRC
ncbi:MAG: hypothetical protein JXR96_06070 [Deltaproteobacteria bacterium]|nr:hypothetical protein [Deltaproteobacteria bacterium]